MSSTKNNLEALASATSTREERTALAIWGVPVVVGIVCIVALAVVWLRGDLVGASSVEARKSATIWILSICTLLVPAHLIVLGPASYALSAILFRKMTGDQPASGKPLKRDARLHYLREELRASHRWLWRYRTPWLMITGSDMLVGQIAPGLKQAGIVRLADVVLVHAAPDGIETAAWRQQIRQLRCRRPIDGIVCIEHAVDGTRSDSGLPRTLAALTAELGWAAPVVFMHAVPATGDQPDRFEAVGTFTTGTRTTGPRADDLRKAASAILRAQLTSLEHQTAHAGTRLCREPQWLTWLAQLSVYIGEQRERVVARCSEIAASPLLRAPLAGVLFAPVFADVQTAPVPLPSQPDATSNSVDLEAITATAGAAERAQPAALLPVWKEIGSQLRHYRGQRIGLHWPDALAAFVMFAAIGWCIAMAISAVGNANLIRGAQANAAAALAAAPGTPDALRAQLALQQQIDIFEHRREHGSPWHLRAGLDRNDEILRTLWRPYLSVASTNLLRPVTQSLHDQLADLSQLPVDALQTHDAQQRGYSALKTYLMLAMPQHADAGFLTMQLAAVWSAPPGMRTGEWLDTSQRLAAFYAGHLAAHPEWRINADDSLVASARNTLVNQIGLASADDIIYQRVLDEARGKYADASLVTLLAGADAHGLFATTQTVPGLYTRAAWDGIIASAFDKAASAQEIKGDWVLATTRPATAAGTAEAAVDRKRTADGMADDLKQRLTARYFSDYAVAWQRMLNSIQWQPPSNVNGAIDQLARLTDAQTSPLVALLKSVQFQAQAGRPSQALSDTLVRKAQDLIGREANAQAVSPPNPLDKPFGPLLALMGDAPSGEPNGKRAAENVALSGVSLSHFLTAATTMRLKLQQIEASPDAQAMCRSLAQAVFQGKLSELSQARDDAALTAASVGAQWAGFGDALFARPLEGAWQTILQPAAASLNDAWRASVAAPFNAAMNGRYPFADTNADASFAELGRYVRPDSGLIARFITTQLAGVLKLEGDHWVQNELAPQALQLDPAFLAAIRQLSTVGSQAYAQGDAGYRFEIMALPSANVTRTELSIDGSKPLVYFNQQESWTKLRWPGDGLNGRAGLMWEMVNAGMRQAFDATGDWAFLRLLSEARIKPLDSARYQLTWDQPDAAPLRYVLRTQVGAGPLDLLKLRGFKMPERVFVVGKARGTVLLPPLPPELQ
ncbi:ImcF-related family protein [Burkholderia sp. WSM2230]|uniref:ImcF-related family protein n=1 Tax=Burkholderia sp. WSM2230 TaxID=944435 RepID=UPI000408A9C0|nr:ImcF-related family protein [Burkholderia sp. WSM2230]